VKRMSPKGWRQWVAALCTPPRFERRSYVWSTVGYRLHTLHLQIQEQSNTIVVVPDHSEGIIESRANSTINRLEHMFFCAENIVYYDPAGTGESWGSGDNEEHIDNLRCVLESIPEHHVLCLLGIGEGLSTALACADHPRVKLILDVNGRSGMRMLNEIERISLCTEAVSRHDCQSCFVGDLDSFVKLARKKLTEPISFSRQERIVASSKC